MKEIWKPIPNYEDLYSVSNMGRLYIHSKTSTMYYKDGTVRVRTIEGRVSSQKALSRGYVRTVLLKDGKRKTWSVHRLVLLTFIGKSDLLCNHKNGVRNDNRLSNLEYCTPLENIRHGLQVLKKIRPKGDANVNTKIKSRKYKAIWVWRSKGYTHGQIAIPYNVSRSTIRVICNKRY